MYMPKITKTIFFAKYILHFPKISLREAEKNNCSYTLLNAKIKIKTTYIFIFKELNHERQNTNLIQMTTEDIFVMKI